MEEEIKKIEHSKKKKEDNGKDNNDDFYAFIVAIVFIGSIFFLYFIFNKITVFTVCEKTTLQSDIKTVIKNGSNLEDVKHVYNTRDLIDFSIVDYLNILKNKDYYKEDVPLSEILSDLRINYFLRKKSDKENDSILLMDTLYLSLLNNIIDENNKKNPFDKLEPNQRDMFINLQQKLDTAYVKVSGDMSKIVDEMNNRNQLVTKYLNDSKISLIISWTALIATIILSLYQIYQNRKTSKKHNKHLDEIEKKINDKE